MYTISNILVVHDAQWQFRHNSHNLRYSPTIPPKKFCTKMDSMPKNLLVCSLTPSRSQNNFDNKSLILSQKNVLFITYNTAKNIVIMSRFIASVTGVQDNFVQAVFASAAGMRSTLTPTSFFSSHNPIFPLQFSPSYNPSNPSQIVYFSHTIQKSSS